MSVFATAADLGLLPTDNVDALALGDPPPPVPVPLLGGGGRLFWSARYSREVGQALDSRLPLA